MSRRLPQIPGTFHRHGWACCIAPLIIGCALLGCAHQPTPQAAVAPPPPKIHPEVPVKHVSRPVVADVIEDGRWYATGVSDCSGETGLRGGEFELSLPAATATGVTASISVRQSQKIRPSGPIRIEFRNSRDSWTDAGRLIHGLAKLALPNDASSLSKFLLLFEGGSLSLSYPGHQERIAVPRAGLAQEKWLDCAKAALVE